ncbi:AEC family transporter [Dialister hominis]|uniref:AEC family transporter n=1 Tax=Dialister hominis TaxID=2582419 RepID=UPI003FD80C13
MDAILQGLSGIFEVAVIAGLGFFLSRMGFFWESAGKDLTKFTMSVALPPLMIYSLYSNFTHDQLIETAPDMLLPFASIFVAYLAGRALAKVLNITKGRRGVFTCTCCIANAIFIGLPVNMALFGEASVPSCMLYYIANTAMFWFLGAYLIVKWLVFLAWLIISFLGAYLIVKDAGGDHKFTVKEMLLKLRTPPLMGFITGVLLILLNIPLPHFFLTACHYVGNIATPMALIVIGIQMAHIPFSEIRLDRDLVGAMFGRFVLSPLCLFILLPFIPVSAMSAKVFLMHAGMPAMTNMTILANSVGADADYSTMINCVSLMLGIFFIPFYMYLLS